MWLRVLTFKSHCMSDFKLLTHSMNLKAMMKWWHCFCQLFHFIQLHEIGERNSSKCSKMFIWFVSKKELDVTHFHSLIELIASSARPLREKEESSSERKLFILISFQKCIILCLDESHSVCLHCFLSAHHFSAIGLFI